MTHPQLPKGTETPTAPKRKCHTHSYQREVTHPQLPKGSATPTATKASDTPTATKRKRNTHNTTRDNFLDRKCIPYNTGSDITTHPPVFSGGLSYGDDSKGVCGDLVSKPPRCLHQGNGPNMKLLYLVHCTNDEGVLHRQDQAVGVRITVQSGHVIHFLRK